MKKIVYQIASKLAACAFLAAMVSVGTASYNGLYQPKVPESLRR
ncbi:cyclic lactone autoinducer peptide [Agathobaculum sp.]